MILLQKKLQIFKRQHLYVCTTSSAASEVKFRVGFEYFDIFKASYELGIEW